ncbi:conserved protein of unknown function [Petrocella atlantisensis]|uniref:DUF2691 domain-containing protein n=1 Tax=Petrocella atlantisensis TaxID=2173034 RepID=A0A3P7SBN1_9FIRM|nr:DUF2691 family protein [Petrocella atlantisensis]VDN49129.1 conserved protein of unknown function [Petrocella atlantisensis]
MVHNGITFEIPNKPGQFLGDILNLFNPQDYIWDIEYDEIHLQRDNEYTGEFLFTEEYLSGEDLLNRAMTNTYYMIFITLRAFLNEASRDRYGSYDDFLKSDSQVFLTVYDCSYVMFSFKDGNILQEVYRNAEAKGFDNINLLTEESLREYNWV